MWPLLLCSIIALAIIAERFWSLQKRNVAPADLLQQVLDHEKANRVSDDLLKLLVKSSPLGRLFAVGLVNRDHGREIMKEAIEEEGSIVVHELDRYLNTLGTIAAITPLLGLLGTVIGMIQVFTSITPEVMTQGIGDPTVLAAGISKALITTATGLAIGIPALMFHRYFKGKVHALTVAMEQQSVKLVEIIQGRTRVLRCHQEVAMKFKSSTDDDELQINLTPLIDIVFLLLIFFMVSTTFTKESQLKIQLPEAKGEEASPEKVPQLVIEISALGVYAVKGPDDDGRPPGAEYQFGSLTACDQECGRKSGQGKSGCDCPCRQTDTA